MVANVRLLSALFLLFVVASSPARAEDYVEPGRFGFEALVTCCTTQGGISYVSDQVDLGIDAFGGQSKVQDSGTSYASNTYGTVLRLGKRWNIRDHNYITTGAVWNDYFGSQGPVSIKGSFILSPYVGLQRHFPNSPVMLNVFVKPYVHSYLRANDGSGNLSQTTSNTYFTDGGFGLTYLF